MKDDAVLLVQRAHEIAKLRSKHLFQRSLLRRDHMHLDLAGAQRGGDFQSDEARADDDCALRRLGGGDDGAAVIERAQEMTVRQLGAEPVKLPVPVASSSLS